MTDKVKVLFVCIHNAARSRMAESLLRKLGGARFEVASAGFEPTEVNPLVVEALARRLRRGERRTLPTRIKAWLHSLSDPPAKNRP